VKNRPEAVETMELLDAILLGFVQGMTEFLPISSSGHLVLGQVVLGLDEPELLFDIVLHVGTLLAVVGFYRRDLRILFDGIETGFARVWSGDLDRALEPEGARLALLIAVASVPTAVLGVVVDRFVPIERGTESAAVFVCVALLVNGAILFAGRLAGEGTADDRAGRTVLWNISIPVALALGTAQGIAVLPGLSRSGLTIIAALLLGVWRDQAARYSFLLSVPAIMGALALKFDPSVFTGPEVGTKLAVYGAGAATATAVGYLAISWLVRLIERTQFHHFSWYCWALGGSGLALFVL